MRRKGMRRFGHIPVQLSRTSGMEKAAKLTYCNLTMDTLAHTVRAGDLPVKLTKTEYAIETHLYMG